MSQHAVCSLGPFGLLPAVPRLVAVYVQRHGVAATVPSLKDVLGTFRMPLADTLAGYWRWSLKVADAAGYDHRGVRFAGASG
jgi:hypothetical protein